MKSGHFQPLVSKRMTETEAEALRLIRTQIATGEARLYDYITTTFRWLMATLFAANGGAVVALLGAGTDKKLPALCWFAAGLLTSILMGILSSIWAMRASAVLTNALASIEKSLLTGAVNKQAIDELVARQTVTWKTWVPSYVGGASFLCLILGMLTVASRL